MFSEILTTPDRTFIFYVNQLQYSDIVMVANLAAILNLAQYLYILCMGMGHVHSGLVSMLEINYLHQDIHLRHHVTPNSLYNVEHLHKNA